MNLRRGILTSFSLASLLLVAFSAAPARAQSGDRRARTPICRDTLSAQRESQLLAAIDQARYERSGNTVSLSEALRSFDGLVPGGASGTRLADLLGQLERALGLLGGGDMLQGMDFGQVAALVGPLSDRLAPLMQGNFNSGDPLSAMQVMMDAMAEIRQVNAARARVAPNRVESLQRELSALRQQCRRLDSRTPTPIPSSRQPLPAPQPAAVARNVFTETCDRQSGSAISYYEGRPSTTSRELTYEHVFECLPGTAGLESGALQNACSDLNGQFDPARVNPTCRLPAAVPDL